VRSKLGPTKGNTPPTMVKKSEKSKKIKKEEKKTKAKKGEMQDYTKNEVFEILGEDGMTLYKRVFDLNTYELLTRFLNDDSFVRVVWN
jgi:hypothetical protein